MSVENKENAYVAYSKDEDIRKSSTSGGVCQVISKAIIKKGGIVSGVYFDEEFMLVRGFAENEDELKRFNKSKYIQARQGDSYKKIKQYLKDGKLVLFIGTPCQVLGLKGYLGEEYSNLYCIDFVCLGVPSEFVWDAYKEVLEKDKKIRNIDFKDKRNGWKNFTFHVSFDDGTEVNEVGRENKYMKSVISKVCSRPSCYECSCRTLDRTSDITVADAWGTENIAGELLDDKGTSSIMINSKKGMELLELIKELLVIKSVEREALWGKNKNAWKQYEIPKGREKFYKDMDEYGFEKAYSRMKRTQLKEQVFNKFLEIFHVK